MIDKIDFWNHMLLQSDAIRAIPPDSRDANARLLAQLDTINEVFGSVFDPADAFEEYVLLGLCRSIHDSLDKNNAHNTTSEL